MQWAPAPRSLSGRRDVRNLIQSLKDEGKTVFFSTHILSDAEALCDRVAVLHKGELRGVGVVQDLLARFSGKVEIIWDGPAAMATVQALGSECHSTGDSIRAVLQQEQLDAAIDAIRLARGRLMSVTPVRASLEDYFLEQLSQSTPTEAAR